LGTIYNNRIHGLACNMVVHGYEETTKYEELLDDGMCGFPLPCHLKNYVTGPFQRFDKMFSYYKFSNICKGKGFAII
jgi:hypothetical protein